MSSTKNPFAQVIDKASELVKQMTLEEKASLCSGLDFWHTKGVKRLNIPSVMVTDGPHGLRKQPDNADHLGINNSVPSTCFPTAVAVSCSFDRELQYEMGQAMAQECRAENVAVILGPAANIKRSPLCGRNFEYISEDPYVTGETATALINGIQSKNIGTSMKHYLANNQEKARMSSNSVVDERALREIYLAGFEAAVKNAQPWTLMCSYNKINGIYASDNKRLMSDIPRGEWGFEGAIMTDWGAMSNRVEAIKAGLDLEMPATGGITDKQIIQAVNNGELDEELVDICAARMTALALQAAKNQTEAYSIEEHNTLARKIARESAVLLENDGMLPLKPGRKLALIGEFAQKPRYQGAGSSKICPHKVTSMCEAFTSAGISYEYSAGYSADKDEPNNAAIESAIKVAQSADEIIAVVGLPDRYESEGFDRTHLNLPSSHNLLIEALIKTKKPIAVIVLCGGAVLMPWRKSVNSLLLMNLSGQNQGEAAYDVIIDGVSPCGKLAETFPLRLEDTPAYSHFGQSGNVEYRESIYVGYRYYDKAGLEVAYPFGYGMSYTSFEYSNLKLSASKINDTEELTVCFTVKNIGSVQGKEIAQVYVGAPETDTFMPVRELRAYEKTALQPGESKEICVKLSRRSFAYYNTNISDWAVSAGEYKVEIGASSRDIRLSGVVQIEGLGNNVVPDYKKSAADYYSVKASATGGFNPPKQQFEQLLGEKVPPQAPETPYTVYSTLGQVKKTFVGKQVYNMVSKMAGKMLGDDPELQLMVAAMADDMPLRQIVMMSGGALTPSKMEAMLNMMNGRFFKGLIGLLKK